MSQAAVHRENGALASSSPLSWPHGTFSGGRRLAQALLGRGLGLKPQLSVRPCPVHARMLCTGRGLGTLETADRHDQTSDPERLPWAGRLELAASLAPGSRSHPASRKYTRECPQHAHSHARMCRARTFANILNLVNDVS